jgi:hypothetical protein
MHRFYASTENPLLSSDGAQAGADAELHFFGEQTSRLRQ